MNDDQKTPTDQIKPDQPATPPQPPVPEPNPGSTNPSGDESSQAPVVTTLKPLSDDQQTATPTLSSTAEDDTPGSLLGKIAARFVHITAFIFSWIIFPLGAVLVLHFFVFQAYHVVGTSMEKTLRPVDYLVISKVDYTKSLIQRDIFHHNTVYIPQRNQIIVFHYPKDPSMVFVKRVIGLPGDHVIIKGGTVTIYNKAHPKGLDTNTGYEAKDTATLGTIDEIVPAGNVFVLGDNRTPGGSFDSRDWGDLPSSYIIGNVVMRLLPLDQVKIF